MGKEDVGVMYSVELTGGSWLQSLKSIMQGLGGSLQSLPMESEKRLDDYFSYGDFRDWLGCQEWKKEGSTMAAFQQHHLEVVRNSPSLGPSTEKGFGEDRTILTVLSMAWSRYLDTSRYTDKTAGIQNMPSKERGRMSNLQWGRQGAL